MKENLSIKKVILFAGAFCSMFIGTGFASGQECMQYFSNFGLVKSILAIGLFWLLSLWIDCKTLSYGYDSKVSPVRSTYQFYGGKIIGKIFDYLMPVFLLATMVCMCAGAGSIFEEYWGWSHFVGVAIIVVAMFLAYASGTQKLIDTLGFIGPIIIVAALVVCLYAVFNGPDLADSTRLVEEMHGYRMGNHWWFSAMQYMAFVPFTMVPFMGAMGRGASSKKEIYVGGALGVTLVAAAILLENTAILANYSSVVESAVPTVVFASMLNPVVGSLFAIIIFLGLFTTAAPMLWIVCESLPTHKNRKSDLAVAAACCLLVLVAGQLPFAFVMNTLYPVVAYAALVWLVLSIIVQVRERMGQLHDMDESK